MDSRKTFSPAEICRMFNITKSTLFRWEEDGKFPNGQIFPPPRRNSLDERLYIYEHIEAIAKYMKLRLKHQYDRVAEHDLIQAQEIQNQLSFIKAQYLGDTTGLFEILATREIPFCEALRLMSDMAPKDGVVDDETWDLAFNLASNLVRPN